MSPLSAAHVRIPCPRTTPHLSVHLARFRHRRCRRRRGRRFGLPAPLCGGARARAAQLRPLEVLRVIVAAAVFLGLREMEPSQRVWVGGRGRRWAALRRRHESGAAERGRRAVASHGDLLISADTRLRYPSGRISFRSSASPQSLIPACTLSEMFLRASSSSRRTCADEGRDRRWREAGRTLLS